MRDYVVKGVDDEGRFVRWLPIAEISTGDLNDLLERRYGRGDKTAAHNETTLEAIFERINIELQARALGLVTQRGD